MDEVTQMLNGFKDMQESLEKIAAKSKPTMPVTHNMIEVKPFSGDLRDTVSLGEFEKQYKTLASAFEWTDDQQIAFLPFYLRGHAKEVINAIPDLKKISLDDIFSNLRDVFQIPEMTPYLAIQLTGRKQGPRESVADFAADIQRIARRAFEAQGQDAINRAGEQAFLTGLRPELKKIVLRQNPHSLEHAILMASKEEITRKILEEDKRKEGHEMNALTEQFSKLLASVVPKDTNQPQNRMAYNPRPLAEFHTSGLPRCFNCNKLGHIARVCTKPRRGSGFNRQPPQTYPPRPNRHSNMTFESPSQQYRPGDAPHYSRRRNERTGQYYYRPNQNIGQQRDRNGYNMTTPLHQQYNQPRQNRQFINMVEHYPIHEEIDSVDLEDQELLRNLESSQNHTVAFCELINFKSQDAECAGQPISRKEVRNKQKDTATKTNKLPEKN